MRSKNLVVLLLFLVFVGIILGFLWVRARTQNLLSQPTPKPSLLPTAIPFPTATPTFSVFNEIKQRAIVKLPLIVDGYTIEYFSVDDSFFVFINKMPYEKYEAEIKKWFTENGLDINKLNVEWGSARGIAPKP